MADTLVTGATGFIGRHLQGNGVRGLVRQSDGTPGAVSGDVLDVESLHRACAGIETVYHCAGFAHAFGHHDPGLHWRINFEGTRNLLQAAAGAGVRSFIFLSSVKAMAEPGEQCVDELFTGEPVSPYGQAKRAAEEAVLEAGTRHGMHVVNLRLAMVYGHGGHGNLERMARGVRAGWFPPIPDTGNRRSLVHVSDVVAAIRHVARDPRANGSTYIVADPLAYSTRQIHDGIRAALGLPATGWSIPAPVWRAGGMIGDVVGGILRRSLPLNTEVVSRLLESACYLPDRIGRELGWRAQTGLAAGLQEMMGPNGTH